MKTAGRLFRNIRTFLPIIVLLILGCAKSISPPGGPVDRTPPEISGTWPASGTVSVPVDSTVTIEFSEAIDPKSVEKAIFITPLEDPPPKIKIKKKSITLSFPEGLSPDRTYVINLGTDLKDAHNVNLDRSIAIAFSTGQTIDKGSISGHVFDKKGGKAGVSLALFIRNPEETEMPVDSLTPEYITQSGEDGVYSFEYLPEGRFYAVAFEDNNKNRRINQQREMIGLPFSPTIVDTVNPSLTGIDFKLHKHESDLVGIRSVSINPDRLIKLRFDRDLDKQDTEILLPTAHILDDEGNVVETGEYAALKAYPTSEFIIMSDILQVGRAYTLELDLKSIYPAISDSLQITRYDFKGIEITDLKPPILLNRYPSDRAVNVSIDSLFRFQFSEQVDSTLFSAAVRISDSAWDWQAVNITRENPFLFTGRPAEILQTGHWYQLEIDNRRIIDRAGNRAGDSTEIITFTTIGADTLGQLSGTISFSDPTDAAFPVVMTFVPTRQGRKRQITLPPGQIDYIAGLIPGYYTVNAFLDRNRNDRFDYGSIIPYQLAEPFTSTADTIRVRTRFESAGVQIDF